MPHGLRVQVPPRPPYQKQKKLFMFSGTYTAVVTPFKEDGTVDYTRYAEIIERQIEAGITGIVPVGTTGESPTLTAREHDEVVCKAVEVANKRIKVIAGTGGNSTAEALALTKSAIDCGADASLQVTPYYNKPTPEGLYRHFSAVADLGLPIVLYNIPGRCSRDIPIDVIERLARHPKVVAVKEAGGDVLRVSEIKDVCDLCILSGDDLLTVPMISVGACGVISVASNIIPHEVSQMVKYALGGNFSSALDLHNKYYRLFRDLFVEVNPVPVKAAMAMMGLIEEVYRLPLCTISDSSREKLRTTLIESGLMER